MGCQSNLSAGILLGFVGSKPQLFEQLRLIEAKLASCLMLQACSPVGDPSALASWSIKWGESAANSGWCGCVLSVGDLAPEASSLDEVVRSLQLSVPMLPVALLAELADPDRFQGFVVRVASFSLWRQLCHAGVSLSALTQFYACHKYLIMGHSIQVYHELGQLLAKPCQMALPQLADTVLTLIMDTIGRPIGRAPMSNALAHMRGYLKNKLSRIEQEQLNVAIQEYRSGLATLAAPLDLMRLHFQRHPNAYINNQLLMRF